MGESKIVKITDERERKKRKKEFNFSIQLRLCVLKHTHPNKIWTLSPQLPSVAINKMDFPSINLGEKWFQTVSGKYIYAGLGLHTDIQSNSLSYKKKKKKNTNNKKIQHLLRITIHS